MHPRCCRSAKSCVHYTTNCNTQSSAPEDVWNNRSKHVELIGIINKPKPLLLHLVGCLYYLGVYQRCTVKQISNFQIFCLGVFLIVAVWFLHACSMTSLFQSFGGNWCLVIRKKNVDDRHIFLPSHWSIQKFKLVAALSSKMWINLYDTQCNNPSYYCSKLCTVNAVNLLVNKAVVLPELK